MHAFTKKMAYDPKMNPNHLALYQALFQQWNYMRFLPVFFIRRETTLQLSKIGSAKTYYKCLKELQAGGYIKYYPAAGKYALARISMVVFVDNEMGKQTTIFCTNGHEELGLSLVPEMELAELISLKDESPAMVADTCVKMATHNVPAVVPPCAIYDTLQVDNIVQGDSKNDPICEAILPHSLIKQKNDKDLKRESVNVSPNRPSPTNNNSFFLNQEKMRQQTLAPVEHFYPTLEEVITFFKEHAYPELEAKKLYYHYDSVGWKSAKGKFIVNWKSASHKWMLTVENPALSTKQTWRRPDAHLHTTRDKDYSQPL